jgi:hypothetical protein
LPTFLRTGLPAAATKLDFEPYVHEALPSQARKAPAWRRKLARAPSAGAVIVGRPRGLAA